jgi:phenylalanyl-tRNA synthetase beta chain
MEFEIPTFRPDLDREIDLIEEVARVYGYDKIETKMKATIRFPEQSAPAMITDVLRWWLPGRGYDEALSNSLTDETTATLTSQSPVRVSNPISKDMAVLRTSLSMSMLQLVRNNLYSGNKDLRLFEIGKVYSKEENPSKPQYIQGLTEEERLCIAITGAANRQSWGGTTVRPVDLYDLKGELEAIFESISLDNFKFIPYTNTNPLTEYGLAIEIHGEKEGDFGKIRSSILKGFDIEQDVYIAELTLGKLQEAIIQNRKFVELPQYPRVFRDLAVTVEESLAVEELVETMRAKGGKLLKKIDLFDIYRGDQVAQGKKSWAFALEFQSKEKTLSQEEIDGVMDDIIRSIGSQFKAELRS